MTKTVVVKILVFMGIAGALFVVLLCYREKLRNKYERQNVEFAQTDFKNAISFMQNETEGFFTTPYMFEYSELLNDLKNNAQLKYLRISRDGGGREIVITPEIMHNLTSNRFLETIELRNATLADGTLHLLFQAKNLRFLQLNRCLLSLKEYDKLRELSTLQGIAIIKPLTKDKNNPKRTLTNEEIEMIVGEIMKCKQLQYILLDERFKSFQTKIQSTLPELSIYYSDANSDEADHQLLRKIYKELRIQYINDLCSEQETKKTN